MNALGRSLEKQLKRLRNLFTRPCRAEEESPLPVYIDKLWELWILIERQAKEARGLPATVERGRKGERSRAQIRLDEGAVFMSDRDHLQIMLKGPTSEAGREARAAAAPGRPKEEDCSPPITDKGGVVLEG